MAASWKLAEGARAGTQPLLSSQRGGPQGWAPLPNSASRGSNTVLPSPVSPPLCCCDLSLGGPCQQRWAGSQIHQERLSYPACTHLWLNIFIEQCLYIQECPLQEHFLFAPKIGAISTILPLSESRVLSLLLKEIRMNSHILHRLFQRGEGQSQPELGCYVPGKKCFTIPNFLLHPIRLWNHFLIVGIF